MADQSHAPALAATITSARAIEERLFRERFRNAWIIAAVRSDENGPAMLLAVDADRHIIGADRVARAMWDLDDRRLGKGVQLSTLFEDAPSFPVRNSSNGQDCGARLTDTRCQTDLPLSDIALSVGFSDHSHFARHFRRLTGMTPSAARWSQR